MTPLLLAGVTGPDEVAAALEAGADILDVVDVGQRAASLATVAATVAAVAGQRPVSAMASDLAEAERLAGSGVAYLRIAVGAAAAGGLADLAGRVKLLAVLFADAAPPPSLLPALAQAGFAGAMLDTQGPGRLLGHGDITTLRGFVAACRVEGLLAGLAGELELPDIPRLLLLAPDLLGLRPAPRLGANRVRQVRRLIPRDTARDAPTPLSAPARADRVLVEDLVLPAFIGAYAHERRAPQRVRFAVTVTLRPAGAPVQGMEDVFSYDIITDGIRLLLDSGHFAFVETLAERIAALLLAHPRVAGVMVRVEKLDAGPARVGVEIERHAGRP